MKGRGLPPLSKMRLGSEGRAPELRIEIGVVEHEGQTFVSMTMGYAKVRLTPERAEEIAVDLRNFALEVRNGGALT